VQNSSISFQARATGPDLTLIVRFDGTEVGRITDLTTEYREIRHEFDDTVDGDHVLEIEMQGKTQDHTQVNAQGEILEDRVIEIQDVKLDDIELGYVFTRAAEYYHDHNGTGDPVTDQFFGVMGCNGRVKFQFSSPLYLWLLENM